MRTKKITSLLGALMLALAIPAHPAGLPDADKLQEGEFGGNTDPLADEPLAQLRPKGFDARTVFSLGEVDTVDLRAGNLTAIVPIGEEIGARGPLSYALKAVYNSDLWYRKTLDTIETSFHKAKAVTLSGEWPDPIYNSGGGWSFHLGRLFPPNEFDGTNAQALCQAGDPFAFERKVDTGPRFVYVDPDGTSHELWQALHGEEPITAADGWVPPEDAINSYSRDGSYYRMVKATTNPNVRWIDDPQGLRRRFDRRATAPDSLPDEWVLTRIIDRYNNTIEVVYSTYEGAPAWILSDNAGYRQVIVKLWDWPGRKADQPMVVDEVILPGFGSDPARRYDFVYTTLTLNRPLRSGFHSVAKAFCPSLDITLQVPRLDSIVQPDGKTWAFTYTLGDDTDDLRMTALKLPTSGKVVYDYAPLIWDSTPTCEPGMPQTAHPGVRRRTVYEVDGSVLEDTRYLRQTLRTADVPSDYCKLRTQNAYSPPAPPYSQQVVGVWRDFGPNVAANPTNATAPRSSMTVHQFNVWPYSDECPAGSAGCVQQADGTWHLASGRTNLERNLQIDPIASDPKGFGLHRSTETFSCSAGLDTAVAWSNLGNNVAGDRLDQLVSSSCTLEETTWARYEVSLAGHCPRDSSPHCLRDSRRVDEMTTFTSDPGKYRRSQKLDYDGLGHYRNEIMTSSWASPGIATPAPRRTYQRYNPNAGTLVLGADHRVVQNINVPSIWVLQSWERQWVEEGGVYRGAEACFDASRGHQIASRTWRCKDGGHTCATPTTTGNLDPLRSAQDLVTVQDFNANGELTKQRFYGADAVAVPASGNLCTIAASLGAPSYAIDLQYQHGVVSSKQVSGESTHEKNLVIDQKTGWTKQSTLDSGEVQTYAYDPLGRIAAILSNRAASFGFTYNTWGSGRPRLVSSVYGVGSTSGTVIRTYVTRYDGLGRLVAEVIPTAPTGSVTRNIGYDLGGRISRITALDAPTLASTFLYDYRGRVLAERRPDGGATEYLYSGERSTRRFTCVGTGVASTTGVCAGSGQETIETTLFKDWQGRVLRLKDPSGNYQTTFTYDPLGKRTTAVRSGINGASGAQTRAWSYDGLGFMLWENIPERAPTVFSLFDTRGNAQRMVTNTRTTLLEYDPIGRLRRLLVGGIAIKTFDYCDYDAAAAGLCATGSSANGQLVRATRINTRPAIYNGSGVDGRYDVTSTFLYDGAGRRSQRTTKVDWRPNVGNLANIGTFAQTWAYDALGNVTSMSYPKCSAGACADDTLTATSTYAQGTYLTAVDVAGSTTLSADLTYHKSGLVNQVIHAGGGGTDIYGVASGMPRIASMTLAQGTPQARVLNPMTYDGSGNVLAIGNEAFTYDRYGRLKTARVRSSASATQSFSYAYDIFDNRIDAAPALTTNNHVSAWTYDAFGNVIEVSDPIDGRKVAAAYDEIDKVVSLDVDQPDGSVIRQLAIYDHDDLRLLRWNKNEPGAEATWTLRDGLQVVRELVGIGNQILTRADFVYAGSRLISSRTYTGTTYPAGSERHYHADQVGTSRVVTGWDPHEVYTEPFGNPIAFSTSGERTVGFQGHEKDGATVYMRGREYFPGVGRFVQVDPGRDGKAWSQYAFATNSPVNFTDRTGLESISADDMSDAGTALDTLAAGAAGGAVLAQQNVLAYSAAYRHLAATSEVAGSVELMAGKTGAALALGEAANSVVYRVLVQVVRKLGMIGLTVSLGAYAYGEIEDSRNASIEEVREATAQNGDTVETSEVQKRHEERERQAKAQATADKPDSPPASGACTCPTSTAVDTKQEKPQS